MLKYYTVTVTMVEPTGRLDWTISRRR